MDARTHGVILRRAVGSDAHGIARVHTATWQTAYRGLMADAYLDALSVTEREARWQDVLAASWRHVPQTAALVRCTWVAEDTDGIHGFCCAGPARDAGLTGAEVYALYVLPAAWRRGMGAGLLAAAESAAMDGGARGMCLWTLRDNASARMFYARQEYVTDGETRNECVGGRSLAHVRYRKTLHGRYAG